QKRDEQDLFSMPSIVRVCVKQEGRRRHQEEHEPRRLLQSRAERVDPEQDRSVTDDLRSRDESDDREARPGRVADQFSEEAPAYEAAGIVDHPVTNDPPLPMPGKMEGVGGGDGENGQEERGEQEVPEIARRVWAARHERRTYGLRTLDRWRGRKAHRPCRP